ncbi:peptidoglycan-associated lipoprotein Pal [Primorskyibacter sp. S187A]|uniref:peptidoglycan-associated lipoprotein Pal n=1 Tax=Primorskyibacter sp. S187A TaxID=3415130 RepID=UPI003C7C35C4
MKLTTKAVCLLSVLAISACTNADRFDNEVDLGAGGGADGFGNSDVSSNPLGDPTSPQYFSQAIGDRVLFAVDQSVLTAEARATLDGQAQWLMTNSDYTATIEGHADEQGTREYNIGLSNKRAAAVRDYLVSKGVSAGRLTSVGYGKERPIAVCSDESCYSQNRRSVTILTGGLTS